MKLNPLLISPRAVYITGPLTDSDGKPNNLAFDRTVAYLEGRGLEAVSGYVTDGVLTISAIRFRVSRLAICDKVITLQGWEYDEVSKREVQIARIMGKPVIHAEVIDQHIENLLADAQG